MHIWFPKKKQKNSISIAWNLKSIFFCIFVDMISIKMNRFSYLCFDRVRMVLYDFIAHNVAIIRWYSLTFCFWNRWLIASFYHAKSDFHFKTHTCTAYTYIHISHTWHFLSFTTQLWGHTTNPTFFFLDFISLLFAFKLTPHNYTVANMHYVSNFTSTFVYEAITSNV